jgi:hypothetical protein
LQVKNGLSLVDLLRPYSSVYQLNGGLDLRRALQRCLERERRIPCGKTPSQRVPSGISSPNRPLPVPPTFNGRSARPDRGVFCPCPGPPRPFLRCGHLVPTATRGTCGLSHTPRPPQPTPTHPNPGPGPSAGFDNHEPLLPAIGPYMAPSCVVTSLRRRGAEGRSRPGVPRPLPLHTETSESTVAWLLVDSSHHVTGTMHALRMAKWPPTHTRWAGTSR